MRSTRCSSLSFRSCKRETGSGFRLKIIFKNIRNSANVNYYWWEKISLTTTSNSSHFDLAKVHLSPSQPVSIWVDLFKSIPSEGVLPSFMFFFFSLRHDHSNRNINFSSFTAGAICIRKSLWEVINFDSRTRLCFLGQRSTSRNCSIAIDRSLASQARRTLQYGKIWINANDAIIQSPIMIL